MAKVVKGELRGKPNRWILDYRDVFGRRRWKVTRTKAQAEDALATVLKQARQPRGRPATDPDISLADYATLYLAQLGAHAKPRSVESYEALLRVHVLPVLGTMKVRQLSRSPIKRLLTDKLLHGRVQGSRSTGRGPLAPNTVRLIHAALRSLLSAAVEDDLITANPAAKLGRALHLVAPKRVRQEEIKALDRAQLATFLTAARTHRDGAVRRLYPYWLLMARTGLRTGEALALRWEDISWTTRTLRVARAYSGGRLGTPKSGDRLDDVAGSRVVADAVADAPQWPTLSCNSAPRLVSRQGLEPWTP